MWLTMATKEKPNAFYSCGSNAGMNSICVAGPCTHLYHAACPQHICIMHMMRNLVELKFTIPLY